MSDVQDARRYRWLASDFNRAYDLLGIYPGDEIEAHIDAALAHRDMISSDTELERLITDLDKCFGADHISWTLYDRIRRALLSAQPAERTLEDEDTRRALDSILDERTAQPAEPKQEPKCEFAPRGLCGDPEECEILGYCRRNPPAAPPEQLVGAVLRTVPREPTDAMNKAGYNALDKIVMKRANGPNIVWQAMYDAAPPAQTVPREPNTPEYRGPGCCLGPK